MINSHSSPLGRYARCFALLALVIAACDGAPEAAISVIDGEPGAADSGRRAGPWTGGACQADGDCAAPQSRCLRAFDAAVGECTTGCVRYCTDRAGETPTFCVPSSELDGASARCVARCDYARFPEGGCRSGFECRLQARASEPATRVAVCRPEGVADVPSGSAPIAWASVEGGREATLPFASAPFPHPSRQNGFTASNGTYYPLRGHYDDSSIRIIVPSGFSDRGSLDLIIHFHGHNADLDYAERRYELRTQFFAARRDAVLVVVQGPKRAPDSGAGKLEEGGGLRNLVTELADRLRADGLVRSRRIGTVVLTAHSGGYLAAGKSVDVGGLDSKVREVYLFDAFYGEQDRFFRYAVRPGRRLMGIVTAHLAPAQAAFVSRLQRAGLRVGQTSASGERLTFLRTSVAHDDVPLGNLRAYLETSGLTPLP